MIAYACSCTQPEPMAAALQRADAVFTGRVLGIEKPLVMTSSLDPIRVTFDVSLAWKGADQKIADVTTASSSASCGYPDFEKGEEYLVFANQSERGLEVSLCSRTQPLTRATDDVALLQTIQAPTVPEGEAIVDGGFIILGVFGAAAILVVLWYILWKKISQWSRTRKIIFTCLFGYMSLGILLSIYFLSYGPSISSGELGIFALSAAYFTLLWPAIFALGTFGAIAVPGMIGAIAILVLWIKKKKLAALGIFVTLLFLFGSLFVPVTSSSEAELSVIPFGKPFAFVIQDQSAYNFSLPWTTGFGVAKEYSTRIRWPQFFLSLMVVGGAVSLVLLAARQVRPRRDQHGREKD